MRRCLACNVHECAACGARKGPEDYPEAEWARAPGTGECRVCNFRTCSRCGTRRAPDGFSHGQWDNAVDRLCIDCNKRGCSMCERLSGPEGFSDGGLGRERCLAGLPYMRRQEALRRVSQHYEPQQVQRRPMGRGVSR